MEDWRDSWKDFCPRCGSYEKRVTDVVDMEPRMDDINTGDPYRAHVEYRCLYCGLGWSQWEQREGE